MRSKAIVQCPTCGDDRWRLAQAVYLGALLEEGDQNLTEDRGVVKVCCGNCGYVLLFDAEAVGIRGLWGQVEARVGHPEYRFCRSCGHHLSVQPLGAFERALGGGGIIGYELLSYLAYLAYPRGEFAIVDDLGVELDAVAHNAQADGSGSWSNPALDHLFVHMPYSTSDFFDSLHLPLLGYLPPVDRGDRLSRFLS